MEQEIKITANLDPMRPDLCRLEVDRPVYPGGSAYFPTREKAAGSALAAKLFDIQNVVAVRITGSNVHVFQNGWEEWRDLAPKAAAVIREHIQSGEPAVSAEFAAQVLPDGELKTKVEEIFENFINPAIASHGGRVRLVDVKERRVFLEMGGGCQGCAMSMATLRQGIESALLDQLPYVADIVDVTDHASGANPYFSQ